MAKSIPPSLTSAHVEKAVRDLDAGVGHAFGTPTKYHLIHDGKTYAPKAVIGIALKHMTGNVLSPRDFSGGESPGQANYVLRQLGYTVKPINSYILTWNTSKWNNWDFDEVIAQTTNGIPYSTRWSTGNRTSLNPNERVYLMRTGEGQGLLGAGLTSSKVYTESHWDGSGDTANFVDVEFDTILALSEVLPVSVLEEHDLGISWKRKQSSGNAVPVESISKLEQVWQNHLQTIGRQQNQTTAWLMLTKEKPSIFSGGYDDNPSQYYSWDNTVPNHKSPRKGDAIVIWNGKSLIGASVIDEISHGKHEKIRYRCPKCNKSKLSLTPTKSFRYTCGVKDCKHETNEPIEDPIAVDTYRASYQISWIDLPGELDGGILRGLCLKPKSQHAIRELNYTLFLDALPPRIKGPAKKLLPTDNTPIPSGHIPRVGKARVGQTKFRKRLKERYGDNCALSGSAPSHVLDAAHLYSYAEVGVHDEYGGLLIRRDLHRLFDLGLILVDPKSLNIFVDESLSEYPVYHSLHGNKLCVNVTARTRIWIKQHWKFHTTAS
jgi:hypothetical protein